MRTLNSRRGYPWSGLDPDRRNAVLLIAGISAIVLVAVALIGYGYYTDRVAPRHATVVQVGDQKIDYAFLERRLNAELARGRLDTSNVAQGIFDTLVLVQREELVRQTAARLGLEVTEQDVIDRYKVRLAMPAGTTREQMAPRLRAELETLNWPLDEYRESAIAEIFERRLRDQFRTAVPSETEHVDVRIIETETQAAALQAKERVDKGDTFGIVAVEMSKHASAKTSGGDLSWVPVSSLEKAVGEVAAKAEIGTTSNVIEAREGFFIVQTNGRETRTVSDSGRDDVAQRELNNALFDTREDAGLNVTLTPAQVNDLAISLNIPLG